MFSHFGFGGGRRQRDEERRTANVEVGTAAERAAFIGTFFLLLLSACVVFKEIHTGRAVCSGCYKHDRFHGYKRPATCA